MTDRELMKWALYALEGSNAYDWPVVEELKERLAQPEQEPVAWVGPSWLNPETRTLENESFAPGPINGWIPLYTAPPRQWQGLTVDEIVMIGVATGMEHIAIHMIENKLREKNT